MQQSIDILQNGDGINQLYIHKHVYTCNKA